MRYHKYSFKYIFKKIVLLACVLCFIYMGWWTYDNYMYSGSRDNSYKIETKRNPDYDGRYTLLKIDENGNNTWDGLMLRVENDKIVDAMTVEYDSIETIKEREGLGDNATDERIVDNEVFHAMDEYLMDDKDFPLTEEEKENSIGWTSLSGIASTKNGYYYSTAFVTYVNGRKVDINKDKRYIDMLDLAPAYDEKSQELWLSKLLSNEKSKYHSGYKLTKYNEHLEWIDYVHD